CKQSVLQQHRNDRQLEERSSSKCTIIVGLSNMALGKVEKFNGKFFPKAANMEKMEYDCDLEADAMIYAETCALLPSYPGTRKDQGENVAVVEPQSAESFDKAAQWRETQRYPVAGATQRKPSRSRSLQKGTPCSQCPSKRCDTAMGLCIMP
ncbi:hypothetical protein OSTOST_23466, partial [Ostertagia ostertagi]